MQLKYQIIHKNIIYLFIISNSGVRFDATDESSRQKKQKETNTSHDEPKRHIVLPGKRNIVGVEDKTDMSADMRIRLALS